MSHPRTVKEEIEMTIGLDIGDEYIHYVKIDKAGEVVDRGRFFTNKNSLRRQLFVQERWRVVLEAGIHSGWVNRELGELRHEVIVANARQIPLIYANERKNDDQDAERLARVGRLDVKLLKPIAPRSERTQATRALIRSRDVAVQTRTKIVNSIRGTVKAMGGRIPVCSASSFWKKSGGHIPETLKATLAPLLAVLAKLEETLKQYDGEIERIAETEFPATALLRGIRGVGPLTSLAFVTAIEDPTRFQSSRDVGAYFGLVPKRKQSSEYDPQLRISKAGDAYVRQLLVLAAHYILGPFGEDCDLRRHGERIHANGGKTAKKRAVVTVARKLAVLLHRLWITGQEYEPLRGHLTQPQVA